MRSDELQIVLYNMPDLTEALEDARRNRYNLLSWLRLWYTNYEELVERARSDEQAELMEDVNRRLLELLECEGMLR